MIIDRLRMRGYSVSLVDYGSNWMLLRIDGSLVRLVWLEETGEVVLSGDSLPEEVKRILVSVVSSLIAPGSPRLPLG